jgi:hypothetical protein
MNFGGTRHEEHERAAAEAFRLKTARPNGRADRSVDQVDIPRGGADFMARRRPQLLQNPPYAP